MKILHINTHSHGGAFNGAYRLHIALLKAGVNSKMLVRDKTVNNNELQEVYNYNQTSKKTNVYNRLTTRLGFPVTAAQIRWNACKAKSGDFEVISFPITDYDITRSEFYKEADLINIHWVGGYLDYPSFFRKNTKPVIFTLRDSNPLLGIFHLNNDLERNRSIWQEIDSKNKKIKVRSIQKAKCQIKIIGISNWISQQAAKSEIFANLEIFTIHNCIDTDVFKPMPKEKAREILNIDNNKVVFSFVADSVNRINKGYKELIDALKQIQNKNIELLSIGNRMDYPCHYSIRHRHLGKLNPNEMAVIHSASDAFIFPTQEESLGNVMLEAMACGTPVIGTPVGGLLDVIKTGFNGEFTKDVSVNAIKEALELFLESKETFDSKKIRENIIENFSEEIIAKQYIQIYKELL